MGDDHVEKDKFIRKPGTVHQILNRVDESWKLALEESGLGIWEWYVPKNEFLYSRKLDEMLGHYDGPASLRRWIELVHPEDLQRAKAHLEAILKEGAQKGGAEYRVRCTDGTYKWVRVTGIIRSRGSDGKPVLVMGLVADVSDYREADYTFAKMAETFPSPVFVVQDGRICYVNPYMERRSGYASRELFAMDLWDCVHPEMREKARKQILSPAEGETAFSSFETRFVAKDGEEFVGKVNTTAITYRQRPAVMGFLYDISEHKKVEKALRESQAKYKALFQNATDTILLMSGETIIDCNEKALEMFRCERDEIVGITPFDLSPPAEPDDGFPARHTQQRLSAALRGVPQHFEWKHRRFDGTLFDAEVSLARVEFDGAPFLHCTLRDITDRKRRDEALKESEHKFRDLTEKSLVGIYLIQDGVFRYVNSRFAEILSYKPHELIETINHEETILPEDRAVVIERLRKRESGEIPSIHHMFRIVTKEGNARNVEVYGSRTTYRGRPAVIGTLLDITERTRAEELLKQAEEMYRGIFENAVEGIFQTSPAHELMTVNDSLVKTFGYSTAEEFIADLAGRETGLFVYPAEHKEFFRRIREEGYVRGFEVEQYRKDRRRIWVSFDITPIKGIDGSILRHVGTVADITERKEAEEKLSRSEAGLRALIGSMNDVIALVDKKGRYTRLNLQNPDMLNASLAGHFEKELKELIPGEAVAPFLAAVRKALRTRQTTHIEYRVGVQGNERWFSTAISPMTNESAVSIARDITDLKMAESELRAKSLSLEETNSALRVLLRNMEEAKKELEENVVSNIRVLVMPHVGRLARRKLASTEKVHVDAIEAGLKNVASPFLRDLSQFGLTPTEIQVANYVRDGRTTKEIIELMHGTKDSIDMHRYHIRRKLGINRAKTNLRSYLLSLH